MQRHAQIVRPNQLAVAALRVIEAVHVQKAVLAGQQQPRFLLHFRDDTLVAQPSLGQLHRRVRPVLRKHVRDHAGREVRRDGLRDEAHAPAASTAGVLAGGFVPSRVVRLALVVVGGWGRRRGRGRGPTVDAVPTFGLLDRLGVDSEDMYGFGVGTRHHVTCADAKVQRTDADVALEATPELVHPLAVLDAKHPDDGALLRGRRQQRPVEGEVHRRQRRIVRLDLEPRGQIAGVKDLQLAGRRGDRVRQVRRQRQRAQPGRIAGHVVDGM